MSDSEATRIGDRLAQLGAIGDFLRGLDPAKINEIVTQLTEFLKVLLGLFGQPAAEVQTLSADEWIAVETIFTAEEVTAQAINLAAIMALIQLILQLLSAWKKPAA